MTDSISKTQRWLDLIAFLVGRRVPVEVEQIMEAVPAYAVRYADGDDTARQTVRRMFERDKDELRRLGIPIETVDLRINYGTEEIKAYRLASRDFYLPYLRLISDTAGPAPGPTPRQESKYGSVEIAVEDAGVAYDSLERLADMPAFPLRREARSAMRKLSFDLSPHVGHGGPPPVLFADRPEARDIRGRVRALSDALLARKRVRFTYHGIRRGESTERDVAPYGMVYQRGTWYLVGQDALRDDLRVFRVGRLEDPTINRKSPATPDYEIPDGFSLDRFRDRDAWELGSEDEPAIEARVGFAFPACLWAERNGYGALVEERPDGSQVRTFAVRQVNPFLRWILSLEGNARIEDPPELAEELGSLVREVLAVYGAAPAGGTDV